MTASRRRNTVSLTMSSGSERKSAAMRLSRRPLVAAPISAGTSDHGEEERRNEVLRCSFCNKNQNDVRKLIAGPTVFICDECVEVCNDIIDDDNRFENRGSADDTADAAGDQEVPRRVRHRPGADEEEARRRGLQPLQADRDSEAGAQPTRRRAAEVEHPAHRSDRHRQDAAGADAGQAALACPSRSSTRRR